MKAIVLDRHGDPAEVLQLRELPAPELGFRQVRVRMLEYSPGYMADHWCTKGHFMLCLEGQLDTELGDGRSFTLTPGMSYQVADGAEPHRSSTASGAKLYVVD